MIPTNAISNTIRPSGTLAVDLDKYSTAQSIAGTQFTTATIYGDYSQSNTQSCEFCEHKSTCKYYDKLKSIIGLSNIDMSEILDADVVDAVTIDIKCKYFKYCYSQYTIPTPFYQYPLQKDWNEYKITCNSACTNDVKNEE